MSAVTTFPAIIVLVGYLSLTDFTKFVKPSELQSEAKEAGIILDDFTGFKPLLDGRFKFTSITAINYGASGSLSRPNK